MRIQQTAKKSRKKLYTAIVAVLILVSAIAIFFIVNGNALNQKNDNNQPAGKSNSETLREEELKSNPEEKTKNQSDSPQEPPVNSTTGKQDVTVLVTSADVYDENVEARGFVTNSVESTGTCTYIFTNGSATINKTSNPLPNSTSTTCQTVKFSVSELSSGKWNVALSFNSNISAGQSTQYEFIVP